MAEPNPEEKGRKLLRNRVKGFYHKIDNEVAHLAYADCESNYLNDVDKNSSCVKGVNKERQNQIKKGEQFASYKQYK